MFYLQSNVRKAGLETLMLIIFALKDIQHRNYNTYSYDYNT